MEGKTGKRFHGHLAAALVFFTLATASSCTRYIFITIDTEVEEISPPYVIAIRNDTQAPIRIDPHGTGQGADAKPLVLEAGKSFDHPPFRLRSAGLVFARPGFALSLQSAIRLKNRGMKERLYFAFSTSKYTFSTRLNTPFQVKPASLSSIKDRSIRGLSMAMTIWLSMARAMFRTKAGKSSG